MNLPSSDTGSTSAGCSAGCDRALAAHVYTQTQLYQQIPWTSHSALYQLQLAVTSIHPYRDNE